MSNSLVVSVAAKGEGFVGTVSLPGLKPTKLARKDGETVFGTRGALNTVARSVAKRLALEVQYEEPVKKVARKAPTVKKTTTPTPAV